MNNEREQMSSKVRFIEELIHENAIVAGDIVAIDSHTWAIHGSIPVDGDVIMAEFDRLDDAKAALQQIDSIGARNE